VYNSIIIYYNSFLLLFYRTLINQNLPWDVFQLNLYLKWWPYSAIHIQICYYYIIIIKEVLNNINLTEGRAGLACWVLRRTLSQLHNTSDHRTNDCHLHAVSAKLQTSRHNPLPMTLCCILQAFQPSTVLEDMYTFLTITWHSNQSIGRGLNSHWDKAAEQPWASCSHLCATDTKQYNLVLVEGWWRSSAGKVTTHLAESNGSLPSVGDFKKSPAGWLPVHRDQLQTQRLITSMGELYLLVKLQKHKDEPKSSNRSRSWSGSQQQSPQKLKNESDSS